MVGTLGMMGCGPGGVPTTGGTSFNPSNPSVADLNALGAGLATLTDTTTPQSGGALTVNGQALGNYDYRVAVGSQTISSFTEADWFSATADSVSAAIAIVGNLTIDAGQVFKPVHRKLFTLLYVTGNLALNGEVSMSARGANHSATGSNISAAAIRIATGTYSGVTNPNVPAAGGAAGAGTGPTTVTSVGATGSAGSAGGTGGGGAGANRTEGSPTTSGSGAAGTSFSGGTGGGAGWSSNNGGDGQANGGKGGNANSAGRQSGGAGNPHGDTGDGAGGDGTGGVLVIICLGQLSGSGLATAAGTKGGDNGNSVSGAGGGSGGGSVTIMYGSDSSTVTPTAAGGAAGVATTNGGAGGDGTARKLSL